MHPFAIFVILYATAFLMEMLEKWKHPEFSWIGLILVLVLIFSRITKFKFLVFLLLTSAYFFIFHFPDVANHVNLLLYLNIALIVGGIFSYFLGNERDILERGNEYYEMMLPILRSALIIVYFLAGFHKLNQDFFNPQVSCANVFFLRLVTAVRTEFLGLPLFSWLTIILLFSSWYILFKQSIFFTNNKYYSFVFLAIIIPLAWGLKVLLENNASLLGTVIAPSGFLTAIIVVTWEILGGLLLSVAKFQLPILAFSLMIHLILAPIGFVDFAALALALLLTFIPQNYYQLLIDNIHINLGKLQINRVYLYFLLNVLGGLLAGLSYHIQLIPNLKIITGLLFDFSAIILIYPLLSVIFVPVAQRQIWTGVSLFNAKMPKFMLLFPFLLVTFGFSSYLGLGTAGNFSMFSNLKTEGITSNHLLLSQNPGKIFNYQEDTVQIYVAFTEKNERQFNITLNNRLLKGHSLPVVEFKKLIYHWTQMNEKVSMVFQYQGISYPTRDIINDPTWKTSKQSWEMKLMNFRIISSIEPNECRW